MKEPVSYDAATDSMYVKIAPGASVRQRMDELREVIIDVGADGRRDAVQTIPCPPFFSF